MRLIFALLLGILVLGSQQAEASARGKIAKGLIGLGIAQGARVCAKDAACSGWAASRVQQSTAFLVERYGSAAVERCLSNAACSGTVMGLLADAAAGKGLSDLDTFMASRHDESQRRNNRWRDTGGDSGDPEGDGPKKVLQSGGNTMSQQTADELNKRLGTNVHKRDPLSLSLR